MDKGGVYEVINYEFRVVPKRKNEPYSIWNGCICNDT